MNAPVATAPMAAATPPITVAAGGPSMTAEGMAAAIARVPITALRNVNLHFFPIQFLAKHLTSVI